MTYDPFADVDLTIDYVDAVAGAGKTLSMIAESLERARRYGTKTIIAMPTLQLVNEMVEFARRQPEVPVVEITSREDEANPRKGSVTSLIHQHITGKKLDGEPLPPKLRPPAGGHLLFITHEAYDRMGTSWPPETREFEIVIDEEPDVILTRQPFKLYDSGYVLTSFLETFEVEVTPLARRARRRAEAMVRQQGGMVFTDRDARNMVTFEALIRGGVKGSSEGEVAQAKKRLEKLKQKKAEAVNSQEDILGASDLTDYRPYSYVVPKDPDWLMRRVYLDKLDDIYEYLNPVPKWLAQGASLFTDSEAWTRMASHIGSGPLRGQVTISGFRRPEALKSFRRATIMSALFKNTMLFDLWSQLGVEFRESNLVKINSATTSLGSRTLRIYWLTDQGWSKRLRDQSGGIAAIFRLIKQSGIINEGETVCVCTNKDDASEDDPRVVLNNFRNAEIMPHNSRGQNRFRHYHQLIHTAALNSYTPDIRWMETVLGIDSTQQRIARAGQEIYQTLMRLSLRDPRQTHDIALVVMDKEIAEWLPQWFEPAEQVEVIEIDSSGVVRRKKSRTGRPALGERPMTAAERQARRRAHRRESPPPP